ncbi:hypothetical protein DB30_01898 [Enhygromyxa salina]|uniref:Uncharacterized protein n=2 Tax=Enhygromyxa salina TaxID=215803 RepID=A0A0C2D485_9BACT|nr:hypothetical protein DB30_01898 [Enhygromyxa salina]
MSRRLRSALRRDHGPRVQLSKWDTLATPEGGLEVYALFEFSEWEACVAKAGGGKHGRDACADEFRHGDYATAELAAELRACTLRGLVRARFGGAAGEGPQTRGDLEILSFRMLEGPCTLERVNVFELVDVDGDEELELAVDLTAVNPDIQFRCRGLYSEYGRQIGWYRRNLEAQYEDLRFSSWHTELLMSDGGVVVGRFTLEDRNHDGRVDLLLEEASFVATDDCEVDDDWWPHPIPGRIAEDELSPCDAEFRAKTLLYSEVKDEWVEP